MKANRNNPITRGLQLLALATIILASTGTTAATPLEKRRALVKQRPLPQKLAEPITFQHTLGLGAGGVGLTAGRAIEESAILDVGVGGSGYMLGAIQRFSSVVVNDNRIAAHAAQITVNGQPGAQADLRQGQQVLMVGDLEESKTAQAILYRADAIGPIHDFLATETAGAAAFSVLGHNVRVNAATAYEGMGFDELTDGVVLEISGLRQQDGTLVATYVGRRDDATAYTTTGLARSVTAYGFNLGGLYVSTTGAMFESFDNGALADGAPVEISVPAQGYTAGMAVTTTRVTRLPMFSAGSESFGSIEGIVDQVLADNRFTLAALPVAADGLVLFNDSHRPIQPGDRLVVHGRVDASGVLAVDDVWYEPHTPVAATGAIANINLQSNHLTLAGTRFELRDLTVLEGLPALDALSPGTAVDLVGYVDGSGAVAATLAPAGATNTTLAGMVTAIDAATGTIQLLDTPILAQPGVTRFEVDGVAVSQSAFFGGLMPGDTAGADWDDQDVSAPAGLLWYNSSDTNGTDDAGEAPSDDDDANGDDDGDSGSNSDKRVNHGFCGQASSVLINLFKNANGPRPAFAVRLLAAC